MLATLTGHTSSVFSAAFSPDGHTLATASGDDTAKLWDLGDPRRPGLLATLTGHTNFVYSVAFSHKGHTLATGSVDGTARLWETDVDEVRSNLRYRMARDHQKRVEPISTRADLPTPMPVKRPAKPRMRRR